MEQKMKGITTLKADLMIDPPLFNSSCVDYSKVFKGEKYDHDACLASYQVFVESEYQMALPEAVTDKRKTVVANLLKDYNNGVCAAVKISIPKSKSEVPSGKKTEKGKSVAPKPKSVEHGSVPSASGKVIAPKLHANPYARKAGRSSPLVADTAEGQQKTNEQKAEIRRMRKEMTYSQGQEMKRYKKLLGVKVSAYNKEKRALIKSRAEKNVIETLDRSHQKEAQGIFSEWEARTEPLKKAEQFINSTWKAVHELSQPRKTEKERDDLRKTVVDEQQRAAALLREYRQLVER